MLSKGKYNSGIMKGGDNSSANGGRLKKNKTRFIHPSEIGSSSFVEENGSPNHAGRSGRDQSMILPKLGACNYKLRLQRAKLKTLSSNPSFIHYNQKPPNFSQKNPKSHKKITIYSKNEILSDEEKQSKTDNQRLSDNSIKDSGHQN